MVTKAIEKVQHENNKQLEEWKKMFIDQKNKIDKKGTDKEAEEAKQRELKAVKEAAARKDASNHIGCTCSHTPITEKNS